MIYFLFYAIFVVVCRRLKLCHENQEVRVSLWRFEETKTVKIYHKMI